MTDFTAYEVATWVRDAVNHLHANLDPQPTRRSLYGQMRALSGVSVTHIAAFVRDPDYNITINKLDRMAAAIKILEHRRATNTIKTRVAA